MPAKKQQLLSYKRCILCLWGTCGQREVKFVEAIALRNKHSVAAVCPIKLTKEQRHRVRIAEDFLFNA